MDGRRSARAASAACLLVALLLSGCVRAGGTPFTLTYLGHDSFALDASKGRTILVDPYDIRNMASEAPPFPEGFAADVVTVSHGHKDHNYLAGVAGNPLVLRQAGSLRFDDLRLRIIEGREGKPVGRLSPMVNLIAVFERDGVKVVHLADSGIVVDPKILDAICDADVVIVNIDDYVMPQDRIMPFMRQIRARTVIPAHAEGADQLARFLRDGSDGAEVATVGRSIELRPGMPARILVMNP